MAQRGAARGVGRDAPSDYVFRGGAFYHGADDARSANRETSAPYHRGNAIGLRPARSVE